VATEIAKKHSAARAVVETDIVFTPGQGTTKTLLTTLYSVPHLSHRNAG
jgi:hypothetical protein